MYEERPSRIVGAVVWSNHTVEGGHRVLPDGCMDLLWCDGELLIAGPDTRAFVTDAPAGRRFVGLRFAPGTGPQVFGLPADALRDQRVALHAVWGAASTRRAAERVAGSEDVGRALEVLAAERLRQAGPPDDATAAIVGHMRSGAAVTDAADALGFSERQLRRRSLAAFGYGPKTLAMILRMERALDLARSGLPLATVAARAGYADQPHLNRDVRALAGVPLGQLVGATAPPN